MSAIGASNRDMILIFLIETFVISMVTFCVGLGGSFLIVWVLNKIFSQAYSLAAIESLFVTDPFVFISLAVASFVLIILAALLPIAKIAKRKPIDSIKNI